MKLKRMFAGILSMGIIFGNTSMIANALEDETIDINSEFGEGLIPESEEELAEFAAQFDSEENEYEISAYASLPSSVDLSTSPCFPPIGNQGSIGSCTAWASTYYQYSYEVNKLNNVTSTANRVVYSPKWTYNNINSGVDKGSSYTDAYKLLKNQGAVTLSEFPYSSSGYNLQDLPTYDGAVEDMRNALNTRLSFYGSYVISGSGTVITSNTDSDLNQVKTALNNGKVLTFSTYNDFNYKKGTGSWSNTKLVYRCYDAPNSGSHAMTIVGYNDNVTCDINGNGTIEVGERGAFKVINSWGTTNSGANNSGVIWIMYDALNGTSANNLDESQFSYTRKRACGTGTNNVFNYINVDHKNVMFVGEVSFSTERRNQVKIQLCNQLPGNSTTTWETVYAFNSSPNNAVSYDGTMVFDYGDLTESLIDFYQEFYPRILLNDTYADDYRVTDKGMKITDNLGNVLCDFGASTWVINGSSYAPTWLASLKKGDINLDRKVNCADVEAIIKYCTDVAAGRKPVLSNLQFFLADVDNDGHISLNDSSSAMSGSGLPTTTAISSGSTYYLRNMNSGYYLDAELDHNYNVIQYQFTGQPNQSWKIVSLGNGYYTLENLDSYYQDYGRKMLSVGTTTNNADLYYKTDNLYTQQWKIVSNGNGTVRLVNRWGEANNQVLEVQDSSTSSPYNVQRYTWKDISCQEWYLEKAAS